MTHYNIDESLVISNRLTRNKFVNDPGNYRIRCRPETGTIYRTVAYFAITDLETNDDEYIQYVTIAIDEETSKRYNLNAANDSGSTYGYKTLLEDLVRGCNPCPTSAAVTDGTGVFTYLKRFGVNALLYEFILLLQRIILLEDFPTGKQATTLAYTSTANGEAYKNSLVTFTLSDEDGNGVDEATVKATIGTVTTTLTSDDGAVVVDLESLDTVPTGEVTITVVYDGDTAHYGCTADKTVTVTSKEATTLSYVGATDGTGYTNSVLSFTLEDSEETGIDGATVTATIGEETVSLTSSDGAIELDLESELETVPTGEVSVEVTYSGSDDYLSSQADATVTVAVKIGDTPTVINQTGYADSEHYNQGIQYFDLKYQDGSSNWISIIDESRPLTMTYENQTITSTVGEYYGNSRAMFNLEDFNPVPPTQCIVTVSFAGDSTYAPCVLENLKLWHTSKG